MHWARGIPHARFGAEKLVHGSGGQRREIASTQKLARLPAWSRQTPDLFTIAAFPIPQKRFMVAGGFHQR